VAKAAAAKGAPSAPGVAAVTLATKGRGRVLLGDYSGGCCAQLSAHLPCLGRSCPVPPGRGRCRSRGSLVVTCPLSAVALWRGSYRGAGSGIASSTASGFGGSFGQRGGQGSRWRRLRVRPCAGSRVTGEDIGASCRSGEVVDDVRGWVASRMGHG